MRALLLILLLITLALPARAQTASSAPSDDPLSVYIMTMGPGDEIFEKFGHNTIRILDRSTGEDLVYNWGMFDFSAENFYINFARGQLDYWAQSMPYRGTLDWYQSQDRSIWLQELDLSPEQKRKLQQLCRDWDGKTYRYNYFTDNCSTKVRDVLDEAAEGQLKPQLEGKPTGTTFRWHTHRLTRGSPLWYLALDAVFGPLTDQPIDRWGEGFLPVLWMNHLKELTIKDPTGTATPIIKSDVNLYQSKHLTESDHPPTWWPWFALTGIALGSTLFGLARVAKQNRAARILFGTSATLYTLLLGLAGTLGLAFWFLTDHRAAWRNENLLEISPLALPLAFLIPAMFANRPRVRKTVLYLTTAIAISTAIGLLLSPVLPQRVADPMALIFPINVGLFLAIRHYLTQRSPITTD